METIEKVDGQYGTESEHNDATPYKRLFAAKLLIHIRDYTEFLKATRSKHQNKCKKLEGRQAHAWIYSESEEVAGFRWICTMLDLNPQSVRSRIELKWREI